EPLDTLAVERQARLLAVTPTQGSAADLERREALASPPRRSRGERWKRSCQVRSPEVPQRRVSRVRRRVKARVGARFVVASAIRPATIVSIPPASIASRQGPSASTTQSSPTFRAFDGVAAFAETSSGGNLSRRCIGDREPEDRNDQPGF